MSRIRSVKPDFFRHELLQDLEKAHGELKPMLVFEGLWNQSDKRGVFPWKPRLLHLDILPFLDFDFAETLSLLEQYGFLQRFTVEGKEWGHVLTFNDHQRISGEEAKQQAKYPCPPPEKEEGSMGEAGRKQEGSRKEYPSCPGNGVGSMEEGKGKGEGNSAQAREEVSFSGQEDRAEGEPRSLAPSPLGQGARRIDAARDTWNSSQAGPPCRLMAATFSPDDLSDCLRIMTAYTDEEIAQAIRNYAEIRSSLQHEIPSPYRSFVGFIRGGVEKFASAADPYAAYRKRGEEAPHDDFARARREERKRKEREDRIAELVNSGRFTRQEAEAKVSA